MRLTPERAALSVAQSRMTRRPRQTNHRYYAERVKTRAGALLLIALVGCPSGAQLLPPPAKPAQFRQMREGIKVWPRSGRVELGVEYKFETGHCGLDVTTDFDGSFWYPLKVIPGDPIPDAFLEDQGTMTLIDQQRALYKSSSDRIVELRRIPRPVVVERRCALGSGRPP